MKGGAGGINGARSAATAKRLYDQAAGLVGFGAWECDLATQDLTWTPGVYDLFELPRGARLHRASIVDLYVDGSRATMEQARAEVIRSGRSISLDAEIRTWRGKARWMRLWIDVAHENGRPARLFGAKQDITAEREAWERLRLMAERDSLTGLANRALFDARYRDLITDATTRCSVSALVLIDVDGFKAINDARGHAAGDECLREVAARLQRVFEGAQLVARIGGDEFAVLLPAPMAPSRIRQMLSRASDALCRPILWDGMPIDLGASIGATFIGRPHLRHPADLFEEADAALYAAKAAGRKAVQVYGEMAAVSPAYPAPQEIPLQVA